MRNGGQAIGRRRAAWAVLLALALLLPSGLAALRAVAGRQAALSGVYRYRSVPAPRFVTTAMASHSPAVEPSPGPPAPAPGPGSTGTVAPPPEPRDLIVAEPSTVVAARPFALGRAAAPDRGRAVQCLAAAVYHEAANQGDDGQRAVAQVVLNRVRHPAFPASVCGVVYQGSDRGGCQFSFACDGSMARVSRTGWARATRIAADALAGRVYAPVGLATHYHSFAVTPAWNRALVMTDAVGAHLFHRWKGFWGTPAAFTQRWSGHEPEPGPLGRPPVTATGSVPPPAADAPAVRLPEPQVLDRWKDSGRPLR